jgi:hypothetical protein
MAMAKSTIMILIPPLVDLISSSLISSDISPPGWGGLLFTKP